MCQTVTNKVILRFTVIFRSSFAVFMTKFMSQLLTMTDKYLPEIKENDIEKSGEIQHLREVPISNVVN